ncbi:MAG: hypothetical protein ABIG95_05075 [Candidatus Woesearchaeota archaeon]
MYWYDSCDDREGRYDKCEDDEKCVSGKCMSAEDCVATCFYLNFCTTTGEDRCGNICTRETEGSECGVYMTCKEGVCEQIPQVPSKTSVKSQVVNQEVVNAPQVTGMVTKPQSSDSGMMTLILVGIVILVIAIILLGYVLIKML